MVSDARVVSNGISVKKLTEIVEKTQRRFAYFSKLFNSAVYYTAKVMSIPAYKSVHDLEELKEKMEAFYEEEKLPRLAEYETVLDTLAYQIGDDETKLNDVISVDSFREEYSDDFRFILTFFILFEILINTRNIVKITTRILEEKSV